METAGTVNRGKGQVAVLLPEASELWLSLVLSDPVLAPLLRDAESQSIHPALSASGWNREVLVSRVLEDLVATARSEQVNPVLLSSDATGVVLGRGARSPSGRLGSVNVQLGLHVIISQVSVDIGGVSAWQVEANFTKVVAKEIS